MSLGHEQLDQLLRTSQAIPLNIAEGNWEATQGDRHRYLEIACDSALECRAIQDMLEICDTLDPSENNEANNFWIVLLPC